MSKIKIFVSHRIDLDSEIVRNPIFMPVRCGAIFDSRECVKIAGDNTGENISKRRMTFNELTVQYWAWKNINADYYGLCHYRRYMVFSNGNLDADPYGNVLFDKLNYDSCEKCGLLNPRKMSKVIEKNDFIISTPYDVTYRGFHNLYEHYTEVPMQHLEDMETVLSVINELSPDYAESAKSYFNGTLFYPCNLFIMKKEIFDEYCQWLFMILFELEQRIDISKYNEQEQRVYGLLGERLLGVFYTQYIKTHSGCKCLTVQRALFWNTSYNNSCKESFQERAKQMIKNKFDKTSKIYQVLKRIYNILFRR